MHFFDDFSFSYAEYVVKEEEYLLLPTLSGKKTGVKVSQGELYVGGKFNHQRLKLVTFPILNLGFI